MAHNTGSFHSGIFGLPPGAGHGRVFAAFRSGRRCVHNILLSPSLSHGGGGIYRLYLHSVFKPLRRARRIRLFRFGQKACYQSPAPCYSIYRCGYFVLYYNTPALQAVFHVKAALRHFAAVCTEVLIF